MSTKIYTAFRLKNGVEFWSFAREIQREATRNVQAKLMEIYDDIISSATTKKLRQQVIERGSFRRPLKEIPAKLGYMHASDYVRRMYEAQLGKYEQNHFCFDTSIAVREDRGRLHLIPHANGAMRNVLDFLEHDSRLENYAYWNNTDPDETVSSIAWKARGRAWDRMCEHWHDMIVIDVVSFDRLHHIDPWVDILTKQMRENDEANR